MATQQQQQPRKSSGGGRNVGRGFFSKERQAQAAAQRKAASEQTEEIKKQAINLQGQEKQVENARNTIINKGKSFFSKIVTGFNKPQRSNVQAEFDERCVNRTVTPYVNKIVVFAQNDNNVSEELAPDLGWLYQGYITFAYAIKLMLANTTTAQSSYRRFNDLSKLQFRLPLKLTELIDQVGKTDLGGDDVLRIKHQNMKSIQLIMKACATIFKNDSFKDGNVSGDTATWRQWYENEYHTQCYTLDNNGVEFVRDISRKLAEVIFNTNFKIGGRVARLPYIKLHDAKMDDLLKWVENVGTQKDWDVGDYNWNYINGLILGSLIERSWLKGRDKNLGDVDKRFKNTPLATIKPRTVLEAAGFMCIEDFLTYDDLIENGIYIITMYNDKYSSFFDRILNTRDITFKLTGSSAQLVTGSEGDNIEKENENEKYYDFKSRYVGKTYKRIDTTEAGLGLLMGYSNKVEFVHNFDISYDGEIRQIRSEFVHSDFKT